MAYITRKLISFVYFHVIRQIVCFFECFIAFITRIYNAFMLWVGVFFKISFIMRRVAAFITGEQDAWMNILVPLQFRRPWVAFIAQITGISNTLVLSIDVRFKVLRSSSNKTALITVNIQFVSTYSSRSIF